MAYELTLLWTGFFGVLTLCFVWLWLRKKRNQPATKKEIRDSILEAANKRNSLSPKESNGECRSGTGLNVFQRKFEGESKERKEQEKVKKHPKDVSQKKKQLTNPKTRSGSKKEFYVKVRNEQISNPELDPETHLPISRPLQSLKDVYDWMPGFDSFNIASIQLKPVKNEQRKKPKTLVCHDMRGGYTEDRFVQGFNSSTCFRIENWHLIDIFVYFSHNIVTIPPPCWTNACHRHGVKVLGTFITEWDDGIKYCSEILETQQSCKRLANQLVDIACYYNFDGWLINIENTIPPEKVDALVAFVKFLTETMHQAKPWCEVIWYDSVTKEGKLEWQNELNAKNSAYFDVCDGIFVNYTWSVHHLSRSAMIAGNHRKFDVYIGVDCFGRGCFGGGGWNSYKALQVIRQHHLSAAIFAPGWVLETQGEADFSSNQIKFWRLMIPYLYPHISTELPLASSFSQGYGNKYFSNGLKCITIPWTNLSCQQYQTTFHDEYYRIGPKNGIEIKDMFYSTDDAFEGGGCLKINGRVTTGAKGVRAFVRLFRCDCELPSEFLVSFTFKLNHVNLVNVYLLLLLDGMPNYLLLEPAVDHKKKASSGESNPPLKIGDHDVTPSYQDYNSIYEIPQDQQRNYIVMQPVYGKSKSLLDQVCTDGMGNSNSWCTRYYVIANKDLANLREIRLVCLPKPSDKKSISNFSLLLGEIRVIPLRDLAPCFPVISNIRCRDTTIEETTEGFVLSTTMLWDKRAVADDVTVHYDILCDGTEAENRRTWDFGELLGKAFVESFRVSQLKVAKELGRQVTVYIRQVTEYNIKAPRKNWGAFVIGW